MTIIKITSDKVLAAEVHILAAKKLNKEFDPEFIKIANAKRKPDPNIPEDETQYVIED